MAQGVLYLKRWMIVNLKGVVMKKMMVVLSLFVSVIAFSQSEKYGFKNLVGSWRNSSGVGLDVIDSNTVYIVRGEHKILGSTANSDFSKNPVFFDLQIRDSAKTLVLKGLLLFVNDNMLQWQIFDRETKPVSFRYDKGDMLFLKRIDKLYN